MNAGALAGDATNAAVNGSKSAQSHQLASAGGAALLCCQTGHLTGAGGCSCNARKASVWTGNAIATAMDDIQACGTLGHRHLDSRGTAEESPVYAPA